MALILQPAGVMTNWVEIMPLAPDGTPFIVPDFSYVLNRCATLPNISVISAISTSSKDVSSPEFTKLARGSSAS